MKKNMVLVILMLFASSVSFPVYAGERGQPQRAAPQMHAPKVAPQGHVQQSVHHPPNVRMVEPRHESAHHPGPGHQMERYNFHGRDYHHFSAHERGIWHGGSWRHETYQGRLGWWWVAGGMWYFFAERPIEAIPIIVPETAFEAPVAIVQRHQVLNIRPQTQQFRYWCDDPAGYSPGIASCPSGWKTVPAQAAPPPPSQ